jgi:hypothetical protein
LYYDARENIKRLSKNEQLGFRSCLKVGLKGPVLGAQEVGSEASGSETPYQVRFWRVAGGQQSEKGGVHKVHFKEPIALLPKPTFYPKPSSGQLTCLVFSGLAHAGY